MGETATSSQEGTVRFATQAEATAGTDDDVAISPATLDAAVDALIEDSSTTVKGIIRIATDAEAIGGVSAVTSITPHTLGLVAIAGAPLASEILAGIAELATQIETDAGTDDARIVTPLKLKTNLASPPAIGGTAANAGTFTELNATATAGIALAAATASSFSTSDAGEDLTLEATLGRVIINGEEAAANAITLLSAAGGIDADAALQINIATSQNAATAMVLNASAGGIDITAAGAAAEDIDITCTSGSVNITAGESAADSIVISSTIGGIDITCAGAAAGEDIDISSTGSSVNISASENAADAITIVASAGGIDITGAGSAGEDIDILTSASINLTATEDAANAIYLRSNGGTSETIKIHADQGTGVASLQLLADVGGVDITSGLASADAINITASNAAGGIDVGAGTAGVIVDTTGAISLDSALASNFTVTGAVDLTLSSSAGSVIINGEEAVDDAIQLTSTAGGLDVTVALQMNLESTEAAADAIVIDASDAAGGINVDCGSGGFDLLATAGAFSIDAQLASNISVTAAGEDLTVASVGGSVIIDGSEAAADGVTITASGGGMDITAAVNDLDIAATLASVNITANEAAADAIVIESTAGGVQVLASGGGPALDIEITNTGGSVVITGTEDAGDAIVLSASAGGIAIHATGEAAQDIDIQNTGGSVVVTASESIAGSIFLNASGAAGGIQMTAGTSGIVMSSGQIVNITEVDTGDTPYAALGSDYYIATDTTGGAMQIDLPAAPETGRSYKIQDAKGQAAIGGNITISGNGNNIAASGASAATFVLNTAYESIVLTFDGTIWLGQDIV